MDWIILLKLFLAHIIGDFIIQPTAWVQDKKENGYKAKSLYLHTLLHAFLAYLIIGDWNNWQIPLLVFVIHTAIDFWKSLQSKTIGYFMADQLLHVASLVMITVFISHENLIDVLQLVNQPRILILITAYLLVLRPFAFIIDLFTAKWRSEIRKIEKKDNIGSLYNAGKYIGMLERFLVLTFILSGNPSAIGMLIAAKSILRFNDLKGESSRKMSEYVLIGTLLSFSLCIITGLIVNSLLKLI